MVHACTLPRLVTQGLIIEFFQALLSGGVDSTVLAALLHKVKLSTLGVLMMMFMIYDIKYMKFV